MIRQRRAQVVLYDGFDPLDVIGPFEVLEAGGQVTAGAIRVELVSAEGPRDVVGGVGGLVLRATSALDPTADVVVVPGVAGPIAAPPDDADAATVRWRRRISRPLRLHLAVDVVGDGDVLTGTSRAGRLPASRVSGVRAPGG